MKANFENYYIDENGNVYSFISQRYLKLSIDTKGYKVLKRNGKKDVRVHRLVANLYLKQENGKNEVNHKNGNKQDNRVENLEWVTHKENCIHAYNTGLHKPSELQKQIARENCIKKKSRKCINIETNKIYTSTREASRQTGIPNSTICYDINHSKKPKWFYL